MQCRRCGSRDLVYNQARGDTVCGNCGELLEERTLVEDTQFVSLGGDKRAAVGRERMWSDQIVTSMERATLRGKEEIVRIAQRLDLGTKITEPARRFCTLAVQKSFNLGRPTKLVASACLYIACRQHRSQHLLIDFSDVTHRPVRDLCATYLKLTRRLLGSDLRYPLEIGETGMHPVPVIDPSFFIERFTRKLWKLACSEGHPLKRRKLESQEQCTACGMPISATKDGYECGKCQILICDNCRNHHNSDMMLGPQVLLRRKQVQTTAMRLIQFMHRDWICVGRRPNGLCGAALLIASSYHNVSFTALDIADIVRMSESTLRQRLEEMQHTAMANMTKEEFEKAGEGVLVSDGKGVPPCVLKRQRLEESGKHQRAVLDKERRKAILDMERISEAKKKRGRAAIQKKMIADSDEDEGPAPLREADSLLRDDSAHVTLPICDEGGTPGSPAASPAPANVEKDSAVSSLERVERFTAREPSAEEIEKIAQEISADPGIRKIIDGSAGKAKDVRAVPSVTQALDEITSLVLDKPEFDGMSLVASSNNGSALHSPRMGPPAAGTPSQDLEVHEETLSDIDDDELELYLLDEEEQRHKSEIWHEVNKDYLEEWHIRGQEAKRKKAQQEARSRAATSEHAETGSQSSARSTGRSSGGGAKRTRGLPSASSCTQSAVMALTKKGKVNPNRINIEALESLFS